MGGPPLLRRRDCHATLAITKWVGKSHHHTLTFNTVALVTRTHINLALRASFDRLRTSGNLNEVEHTSAYRRCYDDGIATLRSQ